MGGRALNFWGWGWEDRFPSRAERQAFGGQVAQMLGFSPSGVSEPARLEDIELRAPRTDGWEAAFCTSAPEARVRHTYGRNYQDVMRGFRGDFGPAPDVVATPRTEAEVERVLALASERGVAVIPYGGGTSVCGGVEPDVGPGYNGVLSLDMSGLGEVLEVEASSRSARIQAGATGAAIERALGAQGWTLRCFPQSFEHSTLGGWIATRAGGHFATLYTHVDDLVQSTRMITPSGTWASRRLPGSGAGPSPDRAVLGSEGTLGVITEAWMRVRPKPTHRATATTFFDRFEDAVGAVRALSQSGLHPSNCRLLDAREAALNFVAMDGSTVVLVGFESADHPKRAWMERALELIADHGGRCPDGPVYRERGAKSGDAGGAGRWKQAFVDAPYLMNTLVSLGVVVDTFETACTWDRFEGLHARVVRDVRAAMKRACGAGFLSMRFTHVYPDGPAPYYTFVAPGRSGAEIEQWREIKEAAMRAVVEEGATITHHHAVGRLHRPWYERQRPEVFARGFRAMKAEIDPAGVMNPGVLWR